MFKCTLKFIFFIILINFTQLNADNNIYWYIGAAFIKPANTIKKLYEKNHKNKIVIIADGSGILLQKIYFSRKGDLYMPGSKYFLKLAKKKKLIKYSIDFIKQIPVFAYSSKSKYKIRSLNDLCQSGLKIALGEPKAMAIGKIYNKIKAKMPLSLTKCIENHSTVHALNISQIQNYIRMNIVDAGIVFQSVAKVNKLKYISFPENYIIYDIAPLAILSFSKHIKKTKDFFNFILKHSDIFQKSGFITITSNTVIYQ